MGESREYHAALWSQGKPVMTGTASIVLNGIQYAVLRGISDPAKLSRVLFWVFTGVTFMSLYWAAFLAWRQEHRKTIELTNELDQIYADVVLDWLKQNHPTVFGPQPLTRALGMPESQILRGLRILQTMGIIRESAPGAWRIADQTLFAASNFQFRRLPSS